MIGQVLTGAALVLLAPLAAAVIFIAAELLSSILRRT